jgi:hypothetical protein
MSRSPLRVTQRVLCRGGCAGEGGASPAGRTWNGALASTFTLAPGASRNVTFLLAWHFPNKAVFWDQSVGGPPRSALAPSSRLGRTLPPLSPRMCWRVQAFGIKDPLNRFIVGNQYANFWPTITDVLSECRVRGGRGAGADGSVTCACADYAVENQAMLTSCTRKFRDCVYNSSLPWQLIDSASPRSSVLRSPTCMWLVLHCCRFCRPPLLFLALLVHRTRCRRPHPHPPLNSRACPSHTLSPSPSLFVLLLVHCSARCDVCGDVGSSLMDDAV